MLLLDDSDYLLLRALAHGNTVLQRSVREFLEQHVFGECGSSGGAGGGGGGGSSGAAGELPPGGVCK